MIQRLTDIVLSVGGFQLYLLAVVVLLRGGGRRQSTGLFAAFLLCKALLLTRWACYRYELLSFGDKPALYLLSATGFFLLAPLLYLYICSLCYRDFRLSAGHLLHGIPALLGVLLAAIGLAGIDADPVAGPTGLVRFVTARYWTLFWTMNLVQILAYILAMLRTVRGYQCRIRDEYSSVEHINLQWLVTLIAVIGLHWLFVTSRAGLGLLGVDAPRLTSALDLFSITIFLVFTTLLVVRGLGQVRVFAGIESKPRIAASKLAPDEMEEQARRLREVMETRRPYLTPSLTLDDLAADLSIPSWQLSQVINRSFDQNFFSFVNGYRIEEAKRRLSDPTSNGMTVLEILLEAGFNSKSAFNEAFRRQVGMTPREYKKVSQN